MTDESAAVRIAREFHDTYEVLSLKMGWDTQMRTRVAFDQLPQANRLTMIETVRELLDRGVISV